MQLREFVTKNREMIDSLVGHDVLNDDERELWVLNDETLYREALAAGVGLDD